MIRPAIACLALALALEARADDVVVEAVRIEAEGIDTARFSEHLAEVTLGEPLDPEVVRHLVEVLEATGEVEDVVVEREPLPGGVALVFRLVPAPLLKAVRVVGDRGVDADTIKRLARLREREALWPRRLEVAAQQVAVHLSAQGYLEALVTAAAERGALGADAVFTVHAGPRCRVAAVEIQGLAASEAARLRHVLGPDPGKVFSRAEAQAASERLRKRLAEEGLWRASVTVAETYDPGSAKVRLAFVVAPGARFAAEFHGDAPSGSARRKSEALLRDGGGKGDVIEEASDALETSLKAKGYRDASVAHREEQRSWGTAIVFDVSAGAEAHVASVRLLGSDDPGLLLKLATRPGQPLQDRLLDEDVRSLTRAFEEDGYAEARIEAEAGEGGGPLAVVFRVRPGPRTVVKTFQIEAPPPTPEGVAAVARRLIPGGAYRTRELALARTDILSAYRNVGFLAAEVTPDVAFSEDRSEATIRLIVEPGRVTQVDHVVIAGLGHTREQVVRRELRFEPGEPLGLQKVLDSQRRLQELGLFEHVRIAEMDPESVDKRSVVVSADEAPRTTLATGIGYGERDLLRGSVEVSRRNLGGLDRSVSTLVRFSFRGNRVLATYREPYLFGRRREMFVTGYREEEERPDEFSYLRYGGQLQTLRPLTTHWSLILRYTYQQTHVFDVAVPLEEVDRQFRDSTFSGPSVSIVNDTRSDPLEPRSGRFLGADVQLSASALGGDSFVKGFAQAAGYRGVAPWATLAVSARLGLAGTFGPEVPLLLPLPDRFFAGGDYSLRGFKQDTAGPLVLSPVTGNLVPTGGNALLLAGVEARLDASRHLAFAVFTEAGNVYPLTRSLALSDIFYTAGAGIRYKTALGPIRVDWGYKLNPRPDESHYHVHVTIGHAF